MAKHPTKIDDMVKLAIICPKCLKATEQTVGWLASHDGLACGNCGVSINLKAGANRAFIEQFVRYCALADREARRLD